MFNDWQGIPRRFPLSEKLESARNKRGELSLGSKEDPAPIHEISTAEEGRVLSGIGEFDLVLGGGLVRGSVILIGGDPGIGKSTLLLQAFAAISQKGVTCLYVSGEESQRQIKMRAERLGVEAPNLLVLSETSLERILEHIKKIKPGLLVIDSVQTMFSSAIPSAPGSIAQVREASGSIIVLAKKTGLTTFLIGHVTKDGAIAGPRLLEHMVDTVLYFEGERGHSFRILRAVKNRFGSTNEIGVFEMKEAGLKEVTNPSEIFLLERPLKVAGSAVVCSMEGTRPILVELQALVSRSYLAVPRRTTIGVDHNRVALLVAVLEKNWAPNCSIRIFSSTSPAAFTSTSRRSISASSRPSRRARAIARSIRKRFFLARSAWREKFAASRKPRRGSKRRASSASSAASYPPATVPSSSISRSLRSSA